MIKNPTDVSAVAAVKVIVNDPAAGTTFFMVAVVSFVRTTAKTMLDVVTRLFVTTILVAPASKFTVPLGRLIICAPVVPVAVLVANNATRPSFLTDNKSAGVEFCINIADVVEVAPAPTTCNRAFAALPVAPRKVLPRTPKLPELPNTSSV